MLDSVIDNFKIISKGKYIKPTDYLIMTNIISVDNFSNNGYISIRIGKRKPIKVIFNIKIISSNNRNSDYDIFSSNNEGDGIIFTINEKYRKREYDGTYTFTVDVKDKELNEYIEVDKAYGNTNSIYFNYLTIEFQDNFLSIDNKEYKLAISNYIY